MDDTEVAVLLHSGFGWVLVPIRRLKNTSHGSTNWIVGAAAPPATLHARLGHHLVTVEPYSDDHRAKAKSSGAASKWKRKAQWGSASTEVGWKDEHTWDPWASAANGRAAAWRPSRQNDASNHTHNGYMGDEWGAYVPTTSVVQSEDPAVTALASRVEKMEIAATKVETRVQSVESSMTSLTTQMQSNFDRLFSAFEARSTGQDAPRKQQRTEDFRGGRVRTPISSVLLRLTSLAMLGASDPYRAASCILVNGVWTSFPSVNATAGRPQNRDLVADNPVYRGGMPMVREMDFADLEADDSLLQVMFCNTGTHRRYLDRFLDSNVGLDVIALGEANHTKEDVRPTRTVDLSDGSTQTVNLVWTPPLRTRGDQQTPGRLSTGVVLASPHPLETHPVEPPLMQALYNTGRCVLRRVELQPCLWLNIFAIYAPVISWNDSADSTLSFLADTMAAVLSAPDELSLVVGDFNMEYAEDTVAQALQARGALVDIGVIGSTENSKQPSTFRTRASESCIDRAMCTPALVRWISSLTVCNAAGTGAHLPIVVVLKLPDSRPPPVIREVMEIPEPASPLPTQPILDWQLTNVCRFDEFMLALDVRDAARAHFIWSTLWESYLQRASDMPLCWDRYTGRAGAQATTRAPLKQRRTTQLQTQAERELWRLLGLLQRHRQGRALRPVREQAVAERLFAKISKCRSLPELDWASVDAMLAVESVVNKAIYAERQRRVSMRCAEWKAALNAKNGMNALARKMVRGPAPKLVILRYLGTSITCPKLQIDALDDFWSNVSTGQEDSEMLPDIFRAIVRAPCALQKITAADIKAQLTLARVSAAHGPDWWRTKELRALPDTALAMLAASLNCMEQCGVMPPALMRGWIRPVPKSGFNAEPGSVRPITVLSTIHRLWSGIRFRHLQPWCNLVLDSAQSAFRSGRSARGEVQKILQLMNSRLASSRPVYTAQLDLSKAFPKLNREKATAMAYASGLPRGFTTFVAQSCLEKDLRWKVGGVLSAPRETRRGTPQGCAISILMFQLLIAPAVRATKIFIATKCACSTLHVYADDIIIVASSPQLLSEIMEYLARMLTSLDFEVNPAKSTVSVLGSHIAPVVCLNGIQVPFVANADFLGSTVATGSNRLVAPNALPDKSSARTVQRWIKCRDRLRRLERMPVTWQAKAYLWRSTILPIMTYDIWSLPVSKSVADAWSSAVVRAVFSGIKGHKDRWLAAAANPQQFDVMAVLVYQLAKDALRDAVDEPMQ
eukprot:6481404-Amphidinium_carterae.1